MADAALVFCVQFVYVLLLGLQSMNVNHNRRLMAAATSSMLGTFGFYITATIAAHRGATFSPVWWSYVAAGPAGIVTSMCLFHRSK